MRVVFDYLPEFERGTKVLRKKYPSFESDYDAFLDELEKNPFSGEYQGSSKEEEIYKEKGNDIDY